MTDQHSKRPNAKITDVTKQLPEKPIVIMTNAPMPISNTTDMPMTETKYQLDKKELETLIHDYQFPSEGVTHEYGYSDTFMVSKGYYRKVTIETDNPIDETDIILTSVISDDGSVILGGLNNYLLPYKDKGKNTFDVIVENNTETRKCRLNYHLIKPIQK